jgi:hypothetical protein
MPHAPCFVTHALRRSLAERPLRLVAKAPAAEEDEAAPVLRWVDEAAAADPALQARPSRALCLAGLQR